MSDNKKTLLFFTGVYPYGRQEAFIENEIDYISKAFDHVIVLPQVISDSKRAVPDNVEIFPLPQIGGWKKGVSVFWGAITSKAFWLGLGEVARGHKPFHRLRTLMSYVGLASLYSRHVTRNLIRRFKANEEVYFYSYWLDRGAVAMVMLRDDFSPTKVVSRVHGFDLYEERNIDGYLPLRNFLLNGVDTVYPISENAVEYLSSRYPHARKAYVLSRLGTTREEFDIERPCQSVFHIVSVSNVIPLKRVLLIFESIFKFASDVQNIEIKWTHFGDGELFDALLSAVKSNVASNLTVDLRGGRPNIEIKHFYATVPVDLFVNLSVSEGIPVSFMEAMSFGIPVMATNVGGVGEIVDISCGWLLPKEVTSELVASKFSQIVSDMEMLKSRARNAMLVWREKYSADVNYPSFCRSIMGLANDVKK